MEFSYTFASTEGTVPNASLCIDLEAEFAEGPGGVVGGQVD